MIRHLASGTISARQYKAQRLELFGPEVDWDGDLFCDDDSTQDPGAIMLSEEALHMCRTLGKLKRKADIHKHDIAAMKHRLATMCLFLYSKEELVQVKTPPRLPPRYSLDKGAKRNPDPCRRAYGLAQSG